MSMEEEKKEAVVKQEEKKEEEKSTKKGNSFTKFFHKRGKSISDSNRESKIENAYKQSTGVQEFLLYVGNGVFNSHSYFGKINEETKEALVYGKFNESDFPPYGCILSTIPADRDKELPRRFYVTKSDNTKRVSVTIRENNGEGEKAEKTYERPATLLTLDPALKEVEVIKVGNTYYEKLKK